jgi:hypothetical protein
MHKPLFLSFPYPTLHAPLFALIRSTITAHLIILTPKAAVTMTVFGPNVLRSIQFSDTLNLCPPPPSPSPRVKDQISHPHKTTGKIKVLCTFIYVFLNSKVENKRTPPTAHSNQFQLFHDSGR